MLPIPEHILDMWEKGLRAAGPEGLLALAAAALFFGLLLCFFGQRLFRFLTTAGLTLAGVGGALFLSLGQPPEYQLAYALGGLVAGAVLGWALYWIWIALFGFGLFAGAGLMVTRSLELSVVAGAVGGIAALILRRLFLIVATALAGAGMAAWGGYLAMLCMQNPQKAVDFAAKSVLAIRSQVPLQVVAAALALAVLGLLFQFFMYRRWRARQEMRNAGRNKRKKMAWLRRKAGDEEEYADDERGTGSQKEDRQPSPTDGMTPAQRRRYEAIHAQANSVRQDAPAAGPASAPPTPGPKPPPGRGSAPGFSFQPDAPPAAPGPTRPERAGAKGGQTHSGPGPAARQGHQGHHLDSRLFHGPAPGLRSDPRIPPKASRRDFLITKTEAATLGVAKGTGW